MVLSTILAAGFTGADWGMVAAILVLLLLLIFFSLAEMGLSRMTKPKAAAMAEGGVKQAKALQQLVGEPQKWVNPLLLSVNICQTVQATLTGVVAGRAFGPFGVAAGVLLNVIVFFVLAEAVPKTYALQYPEKAALSTALGTKLLVSFPPLRIVSGWLITLTNVIVRGKGLKQGPFVSEQELLGIVDAAYHDDIIEEEERDLIESIIEFGDTVAREVMVPLPDMITVSSSFTLTQAIDVAIEHGVSRLPVLAEDDDVVGIAFIKDLMKQERAGLGSAVVTDHMRAAEVIPENKPVNRLMREMQAKKFHLAVVADEYGSIAGLITLEDCLEELVGEIVDEYDTHHDAIVHLEDGQYLIDGSTSVSDVNDKIASNIPDEEWDSIGGFVFGTLEHVPALGEFIDFDGWRLTVVALQGRRIRKVRVGVISDPDHTPAV
ncbi:MAG: HlyC/CorC family transporter [Ilumatobacteraceae bacterium]|nr:HlyC/CorC family transporter [Ilumatobacteraceae bacterium]